MEKDEILSKLEALDERLRVIEERVSMGRGALGMFIAMLTLIGTITGLVKLLGK